MYKKVLVPVDGSGLAECVFEHEKAVAKGCSVPEVDFLFVAQLFRQMFSAGTEWLSTDMGRSPSRQEKKN